MTRVEKALLAVTITVALGTGIYQARQASRLRGKVLALQQPQAPVADQIGQLTRDRDDARAQLAALRDENERLKHNTDELLRLRGELVRLRSDTQAVVPVNTADASMAAAATSWLNRANQLKQYLEQHPEQKIPEFQFLTDRDWLAICNAGFETENLENRDDYRRRMESLRVFAEAGFGRLVQVALNKYASANDDQFPSEISHLQPYCEPAVLETLRQLYEIKSVDILPATVVKDFAVKVDWVIVRKNRVNSNSTSRLAVFINGSAYWQSPP